MTLFRFGTPVSRLLTGNTAGRICFTYALFSTLWILFSDQWLFFFFSERAEVAHVSMAKGVMFVLATSAIIYALVDRGVRIVKRSEENYRTLIETSPDAIALLDLDVRITMANERLLSLFGYERSEDVLGKSILDFTLGDDNGQVSAGLRTLLRTGLPHNEQYRALRKDGSSFPVESSASVILDEGRKPKAIMIILRDTTERTQAERELRLLAQTVASTKDCVSITDLDDKILFVNDAFLETYGYARSELIGSPVSMVRSPLTSPEIGHQIYPATLKGGWYGEIFNRRKDGSDFPVELWTSVVKNDADEPVAMVGVARDITERKRTVQALKESEMKFRGLIEQAADGVFMADHDGKLLLVNPKACDMLGYSEEELLRLRIHDTYPADELDQASSRMVDVKARGASQFERNMQRKDGTIFRVEVSLKFLEDGTFQGIVRDITARKQAEEALRHSEEQNRAIVNAVPDLLFRIDKHGLILDYRAPDESRLYVLPAEFLGKNLKDVLPPGVSGPGAEAIKKALSSGRTSICEYELPLQGEPHYYESRIVPLSNDEVLAVIRDITDRKRAEERLSQLSLAVEQSPVSIVITDVVGNIVYVNPKFTRVTGYGFEEVLGKNPRILKSGDKEIREYRQLWETITEGKEWRGEFHNKRKNGELFWEEASISSITDNEGRISHFVAVKEDITERKALEDQLRQAQKLEGIGTLAGGIAHDFNNILGIIIGHAGLIRRFGADADRISKSLDAIHTAVQRGAGLARQVLTFARKADVLFEPIVLNDLVGEMLAMMGETFPKTINVSHDLERNLPAINADRTQLHQTLLNLCVNARDAMQGNGTISITTSCIASTTLRRKFPTVEDIQYLCLTVSDTGAGMDEGTKRRIFEPFFTTKEKGRGTGLGLAVVYGIIQSHHGFIDVESAPGNGTTFRLYFPVPPRGEIPNTIPEEQIYELSGGNETLLVIEDEEMLSHLLRTVLESKGYRVLVASDGEQGLATYERHRDEIALVLSDIGLPKLGGDDLFLRIRRINPDVKYILASGYIDPEMKIRLTESGAHAFIHKPYIPNEILKRIREEIDRCEN